MFGLSPATKIYIAAEGVDMRKGFDGLFGLVRDRLGQDPLSGHLFLFSNRARSWLKVLVCDGSGLWVCAKRLEKGRFRWPAAPDGQCVVMRPEELAMLINGLDLAEARPRKNWLRHRHARLQTWPGVAPHGTEPRRQALRGKRAPKQSGLFILQKLARQPA